MLCNSYFIIDKYVNRSELEDSLTNERHFMVNVIRINFKYVIQLFYAKSLLNNIHKQIYFYEKATLQHFEKKKLFYYY